MDFDLNMLPKSSFSNMSYISRSDSKLFGKFSSHYALLVKTANLNNIFFKKLERMATFFNFIQHIVTICSNEKMIRVHTRSVVAFMTNKSISRYYSFKKFIADSMCATPVRIFVDFSISIFACGPNPFPTFMKWYHLNAFKEFDFQRIHEAYTL